MLSQITRYKMSKSSYVQQVLRAQTLQKEEQGRERQGAATYVLPSSAQGRALTKRPRPDSFELWGLIMIATEYLPFAGRVLIALLFVFSGMSKLADFFLSRQLMKKFSFLHKSPTCSKILKMK